MTRQSISRHLCLYIAYVFSICLFYLLFTEFACVQTICHLNDTALSHIDGDICDIQVKKRLNMLMEVIYIYVFVLYSTETPVKPLGY